MDAYLQSQQVKPSISDVINLIYQAALQPHLWQKILTDIRILCGADQCTLFFYDALEPARCLASAARADEEVLTRYLKNFIKQQAALMNDQLHSLPEGQVVTDHDIRLYIGEEYSGVVGQDYMQTLWPNLKFEAGIVLLRSEASCAGLGLQNFVDSPALQYQSISLLQKLSPHLRKAMRIHQQFMQLEHTHNALTTVLHAAKIGIVLLDEKLTIQFINNKAKHSLGKVEDSTMSSSQKLSLEKINKEQIHKIVTQFNTLAKDSHKNGKSNAELKINYCNGHLKITGYVLQKHPPITNAKSSSTIHSPQAGYLLLIQDSNPTCHLNQQYLHSAYEITATERKLILGLINGASLIDSANSQTTKPSTVRWHLKNIMQKTLTHSQTELTRLMLELRD